MVSFNRQTPPQNLWTLIFSLIVVFIHWQNSLICISCIFDILVLLSNLTTFVFHNKYLLHKRFFFLFFIYSNIFFDNCLPKAISLFIWLQKRPPRVLYKKNCFWKFCQIHSNLFGICCLNLYCSFRHVTLLNERLRKRRF